MRCSVPLRDSVLLCAIASIPLRDLVALLVISVLKGGGLVLPISVIGTVEVSKSGGVRLDIVNSNSVLTG